MSVVSNGREVPIAITLVPSRIGGDTRSAAIITLDETTRRIVTITRTKPKLIL